MNKIIKKMLMAFTAIALLIGAFSFTAGENDKYFLIAKNLDIFATLFKEVNTYYVDDIEPTDFMKEGITAMLKSLDPYTNYIPEDKIEDYRFMTTGQYGGIGSVIGYRNKQTMVLKPYKGYPADKAGLKIGDIITKIDGIDIAGKNTQQVSTLLKGQADTKVIVTIKRPNKEEEFDVEITRQRIKVHNVAHSGMITDDVGYIELTGFTQKASKEVREAMKSLKEKGAKKFVFDLRRNPGGLLNEAVNVSNVFVNKDKEVVSTKGKVKEWNKTYKTLNAPLDTESPLVILTSGGTASAAEIVSGVIQDYDRGVLVGATSFGKGLVQATRPLSYNSQLKITTAKYYIPSGRCIQAIDYANKKDGKAKKLADSVRTAFKTEGGRTVYDGAGLRPDVAVEKEDAPEILIALSRKNIIFDYATDYYYEHKEIAPAKEFKISDVEYKEFINWTKDKDLEYETRVEREIASLEKIAKNEGVSEKVSDEIEALKNKIAENKKDDLITHQKLIKEMLEGEIVLRYYYEEGTIEASFDSDNDIQEALSILKDEKRYNDIVVNGVTLNTDEEK